MGDDRREEDRGVSSLFLFLFPDDGFSRIVLKNPARRATSIHARARACVRSSRPIMILDEQLSSRLIYTCTRGEKLVALSDDCRPRAAPRLRKLDPLDFPPSCAFFSPPGRDGTGIDEWRKVEVLDYEKRRRVVLTGFCFFLLFFIFSFFLRMFGMIDGFSVPLAG